VAGEGAAETRALDKARAGTATLDDFTLTRELGATATSVGIAVGVVVEVSTGTTTTTVVGVGAQPVVQSFEVVVKAGETPIVEDSAGQ
jgi:hypothetical protein